MRRHDTTRHDANDTTRDETTRHDTTRDDMQRQEERAPCLENASSSSSPWLPHRSASSKFDHCDIMSPYVNGQSGVDAMIRSTLRNSALSLVGVRVSETRRDDILTLGECSSLMNSLSKNPCTPTVRTMCPTPPCEPTQRSPREARSQGSRKPRSTKRPSVAGWAVTAVLNMTRRCLTLV